jgi:CBS domain-containing protein
MFKSILIAFDGSPGAALALKEALRLASLAGADVTALSVIEKLPAYAASVGEVEDTRRAMESYFADAQARAVEQARSLGLTLKTAIRAGRASQTIVHFAEESGCDLIVIGADGQSGLGGTADRVAETAPCSVLIIRTSMRVLRVRDIMTSQVTTVSPSAPLSDVVELLIQRDLKAVPVVEAGKVVGIITGGDLLRRAGMGLRLSLQQVLPQPAVADQLRQLAEQGKTAATIMTTPVITVPKMTKVSEAARLMAAKHVKRLPVINDQGQLVGIVSRLDILAAVASVSQASETIPLLPAGAVAMARDVMVRNVPTVSPETPLADVVEKIVATPLRRVVVLDEARHVVGIVVDADLLAQLSPREPTGVVDAIIARLAQRPGQIAPLTGVAADVMVRDVFTVREDTPLTEIITRMLEKRVKRLVVVDTEGRLAGMVDRENLLRVIASAG